MADVHTPEARSRNMAAIKAKDTKPELLIRRKLHSRGLRYKLHDNTLPGKPDLVFPKYSAVLFVNGCFWHQHDCPMFKLPATRTDFWRSKITQNAARDKANRSDLTEQGWRVAELWECALRGKRKLDIDQVVVTVDKWLHASSSYLTVRGSDDGSNSKKP